MGKGSQPPTPIPNKKAKNKNVNIYFFLTFSQKGKEINLTIFYIFYDKAPPLPPKKSPSKKLSIICKSNVIKMDKN